MIRTSGSGCCGALSGCMGSRRADVSESELETVAVGTVSPRARRWTARTAAWRAVSRSFASSRRRGTGRHRVDARRAGTTATEARPKRLTMTNSQSSVREAHYRFGAPTTTGGEVARVVEMLSEPRVGVDGFGRTRVRARRWPRCALAATARSTVSSSLAPEHQSMLCGVLAGRAGREDVFISGRNSRLRSRCESLRVAPGGPGTGALTH